MADTLLSVAQRVARKVGLDPTFTSFSNTDETNDLVQYINDAYFELICELPKDVPYLLNISTGTVTTVNGTRAYSLPAAVRVFNLLDWSFQDETNGDVPLEMRTFQQIQKLDSKYDETTGKPEYVYRDVGDKIALYPVPDEAYTVSFKFSTVFTRLSATTDVFIVPDEWVRYIELKARFWYEKSKGFSEADTTFVLADSLLVGILTEAEQMVPKQFYSREL